jgi:homoserine kinase
MATTKRATTASKIAFRGGAAHVRVPATSANLGPGYDALGLALGIYDDVVARVADEGLSIDVAGEGEDVARDENHLVVRSMRATFERLGGQPRGLELSCANRIPHGRGLGSSAAAIAAGVLLARALVLGGEQSLPDSDVLALASELEGHPDNVAAALLGGLTVAWTEATGARALTCAVDPRVRPVVFIPPFESSTHEARGLLPASIAHADAAIAAGRSALLIAALTAAPEALLPATYDTLHQPYRAPAMPESAALVAALRENGHAAVVSGAGPTVLVLANGDAEVEAVTAFAPPDWRVLTPSIDTEGGRQLSV